MMNSSLVEQGWAHKPDASREFQLGQMSLKIEIIRVAKVLQTVFAMPETYFLKIPSTLAKKILGTTLIVQCYKLYCTIKNCLK